MSDRYQHQIAEPHAVLHRSRVVVLAAPSDHREVEGIGCNQSDEHNVSITDGQPLPAIIRQQLTFHRVEVGIQTSQDTDGFRLDHERADRGIP